MKWKGRPQSKNVKDMRSTTWEGRVNQFVADSLSAASSNKRPNSRFGKQGTRKKNTGYKTGGGF